jgi:hypothetical protein
MLTRLIQVTGCDKELMCAFTLGIWSGGYHSMRSVCTYGMREKKSSVSRQTVHLSDQSAGLFTEYLQFRDYPSHYSTAFSSVWHLLVTAEFNIGGSSMTKFYEFSALSHFLALKERNEAEAMENRFIRTWSLILKIKATVLTFLWGQALGPREASGTCNCGSC